MLNKQGTTLYILCETVSSLKQVLVGFFFCELSVFPDGFHVDECWTNDYLLFFFSKMSFFPDDPLTSLQQASICQQTHSNKNGTLLSVGGFHANHSQNNCPKSWTSTSANNFSKITLWALLFSHDETCYLQFLCEINRAVRL